MLGRADGSGARGAELVKATRGRAGGRGAEGVAGAAAEGGGEGIRWRERFFGGGVAIEPLLLTVCAGGSSVEL
jgi:hypothetical protein